LNDGSPPDTQDVQGTEEDQDLAARLGELAGGDIGTLEPTDDEIVSWNRAITKNARSGFEHRVLLGIAINGIRPAYGKVSEFTAQMADQLRRSGRWVRETVRVSSAVSLAVEQGIVLPLGIRDMAWSSVPGAIDNLRNGRPLDWKQPQEPKEPTDEEREAAVAQALHSLTEALEAVADDQRRKELANQAIAALQPFIADIEATEEERVEAESPSPSAEPDRQRQRPSFPRGRRGSGRRRRR